MSNPRPAWGNGAQGAQWHQASPNAGRNGGYSPQQAPHAAPQVVPPPTTMVASNSSGPAGQGAAKVLISKLSVGEEVDIFHRYSQDPNGYFMVQVSTQGLIHPSIGKTDGWTHGVVTEAWNIDSYNVNDFRTWVEIRWTHPKWYNRRGHKLDVSRADMTTQRVMPEQIREKGGTQSEARQQARLTLFHVRWGGEQQVNPVTEGQGGWGQIGSTPSDNYINAWENTIFTTIGPCYEIFSAFIQSTEELNKIPAPFLRTMMNGQSIGALYFLWPIMFQDGHNYPAYVNNETLIATMCRLEGSGIPTRFPHHSHLYRVFASKEWTSQMCLHPLLKVPLTTKVSRQAIIQNPAKAAEVAVQALANLAQTRSEWAGPLNQEPPTPGPVVKGVAKLGWSWEAMDVRSWTTGKALGTALTDLIEQPDSQLESCFVQEWVDFDVEIRHFIVEPDLAKPSTWKPKKIIYTVFKQKDQGSFRDFDRYDRKGCLRTCFQNDDAALADAEWQSEELIAKWLQWLQAQSHEMPVVVRFDILAKRTGPGKARVMTGELTELGGCFLGWPNGPSVVMGAMLRSCLKDPAELVQYQY